MADLTRRNLFQILLALPVAIKVAYDCEAKPKPLPVLPMHSMLTSASWNNLVERVNTLTRTSK